MSHLVDTSVVIKWFHDEADVADARRLHRLHQDGRVSLAIIDLGVLELGNFLIRRTELTPDVVADRLADLETLLGPPVTPADDLLRDAARLAREHSLTYYDATWAAAAQSLQAHLVSADHALLGAGLALTPLAALSLLPGQRESD